MASIMFVIIIFWCLHPEPLEAQQTLSVACRMGQPPINDLSEATKSCVGLFAEVFMTACTRGNIAYNMSYVVGDIEKYLATNTSQGFDIVISFHTVTPERLISYDFSTTIIQSDDVIALRPKFAKKGGSFSGSVIRASVLYIFSVISIIIGVVGLVILIFESYQPDSNITSLPPYRRILWSLEMAFEAVVEGMTSEKLNSQVSRSIGKVGGLAGLFVVAIFSAVITSQLTASSLADTSVTLKELRGRKVAVASTTLQPFLEGFHGMSTVLVGNINDFAVDFFNGAHPDVDGIASSEEVINYLYSQYLGVNKGYVLSETFTLSGSNDLKAFPMNRRLSNEAKLNFNLQIEKMRSEGTLASLISKYLTANTDGAASDIPVDTEAELGLRIANGVLFGCCAVVVIGLAIWHFVRKSKTASSTELRLQNSQNKSVKNPVPSNITTTSPYDTTHVDDPVLVWRGKEYKNINSKMSIMLDAIIPVIESADEHIRHQNDF